MITLNVLADNILIIQVSGKLEEYDFSNIGPKIDQLIEHHGNLRLLIDAAAFEGWSSMAAATQHFTFVRDHHQHIERIAVIAGHEWQHWIVGMASVFVHPGIKVFEKNQFSDAETWLQIEHNGLE